MDATQLILYSGSGLAALFGTGGVGYAIVQAFLKRNDREVQANAAKILTGVASDLVKDLRAQVGETQKERNYYKRELKGLRQAVDRLLEAVDQVISENSLLQTENMVMLELKEALRNVKDKIY